MSSRIPPMDDVDGHLIYSPHDYILDRCKFPYQCI